ncbi:hypothetical protein PWT90_09524 [Aphanocladium album]|nr:hypothetical protein PWT90_09524 [Aphanocladium album]
MVRILLTGGNGFVASHILDMLRTTQHTVAITVRSEEKKEQVLARFEEPARQRISVFIVPDFTVPGAFDQCLQSQPPIEAVMHVASPFYYSATDIQRELLDPSVIGTESLLGSIHRHCPTVKTVVLTSSFAAILDSYKTNSIPEHTYTVADWNPLTEEDAMKSTLNGYRASKILAEKAAWNFMDEQKPSFTLVALNPTLAFGPVIQPLAGAGDINTSNQRISGFLSGAFRDKIPDTGLSFYLWIDVRDLAVAHIRAVEKQLVAPESKRYLCTQGYFTNREICSIIARRFLEYQNVLPSPDGDDGGFPREGVYGFDCAATTRDLELEYRTLEESVVDAVISLQSDNRRWFKYTSFRSGTNLGQADVGKVEQQLVPRYEITRLLPSIGGKCSQLATVSRAWQSIIEPLNFAEISLTVPRLADPNSQAILLRRRRWICYIWFRVELKGYDCRRCANTDQERWGLDDIDNQFIADAFESLFTILSAWEPRGDLVLDISVYSPSDNQHWFKYLSFCSDSDRGECPSLHGHEEATALMNDPAHGWLAGKHAVAPPQFAIELTFNEIMGEGPFDDEEPEMQWWRGLPFVPVVGVVLLRQQTRRRWKPVALANLLTRFPNVQELCYEPWREWTVIETQTDQRKCSISTTEVAAAADQPETGNQTLIESFARTQLCKLMIFENFNEAYPERYFGTPAIRVPNAGVSQKLALASLHLTILSASFMADAGQFFAARQASWTWEKLTTLALTSSTLVNDADPSDINDLLRDAAAAALKMPKLETMELWNGRRGVAMLFRYQRAHDGQPATITLRGTSAFNLQNTGTRAWDIVAYQHCRRKVAVYTSFIDPYGVRCHGDAIRQLKLSTEVARPISLRQILSENRSRVWD